MNRKEFLTIAAATPFIGLLSACAPSTPIIYARVVYGRVVVPLPALGVLSVEGSYAKVYVDGHTNPILVFEREGGTLAATLSTCSHAGCEVKKLRTKFECPCHGSEYDLEGNVVRGPAPEPLQSFRVVQVGDSIEIIVKG